MTTLAMSLSQVKHLIAAMEANPRLFRGLVMSGSLEVKVDEGDFKYYLEALKAHKPEVLVEDHDVTLVSMMEGILEEGLEKEMCYGLCL